MRPVNFTRESRADVEDVAHWYNEQREGLGEEFRIELGAAVQRIVAFPSGWARLGRRVRRCSLNRFPYGVYYAVLTHEVLVVAVLHLHRRPGIWKRRL
jgi:plasmid stabilization system protein ParE